MVTEADIAKVTNDKVWFGGWYQPITFPNGLKTASSKWSQFHEREDLGEKKWEKYVVPHLKGYDGFLEIGSNAGLYLVLAELYGYHRVYGIEPSPYFFKQSKLVLKEFKSEAVVVPSDALKVDYAVFRSLDVVLLSNTLYWVGYADETGYIKDYDKAIDTFLCKLSCVTKRLIVVGDETTDRIGGKLEKTVAAIGKHFDIVVAEVPESQYRRINVVVADSKVKEGDIDIDVLISRLKERGKYAEEFIDTFTKYAEGYFAHKQWTRDWGKLYRNAGMTEKDRHDICVHYLSLARSLEEKGLIEPIRIFVDEGRIEIDGWHRLILLKALGYKTVKYRTNKDVKLDT